MVKKFKVNEMNQNILIELERRAEKLVLQIPAALDSNEYTSLFNEKFAELIVQECANVAVDCDVIEYSDFRQGVAREIKEHFGVE